jgi:hypothetical protein
MLGPTLIEVNPRNRGFFARSKDSTNQRLVMPDAT